MLTGGCFCGKVRYSVPVAAVRFGFASCHCSVCRRTHGAPFVMWLGMGREEARQLTMQGATSSFAPSPSSRKHFCPACGTQLQLVYEEHGSRFAGEVHLPTATLDEACVPALEAHIAAAGRPRHLHVFFSDKGACLGDVSAWASAPRLGGPTGLEKIEG